MIWESKENVRAMVNISIGHYWLMTRIGDDSRREDVEQEASIVLTAFDAIAERSIEDAIAAVLDIQSVAIKTLMLTIPRECLNIPLVDVAHEPR